MFETTNPKVLAKNKTVDELGNGRALYHMMTSPRRVFLGEKISKEDEQDIREICEK